MARTGRVTRLASRENGSSALERQLTSGHWAYTNDLATFPHHPKIRELHCSHSSALNLLSPLLWATVLSRRSILPLSLSSWIGLSKEGGL